MSKLTNKIAIAGLSLATALSLSGLGALVVPAGAVTIAELQAQIAALQAQLVALGGENTSTTTCYVWNGSLTIGSTGPDVTTLQNYLTGTGHFTFSGGATGYFGPITQAAVAAWQAANGVAPAVGYWGPISQAKYASMCSAAGEEEEAGDLTGGAGSADYTLMSGITNEEVGEDEEDVEVAGVEVEAQGSDLELTAVRLVFNEGSANNDFDNYADEVSVWLDGEEFARVDADVFTDNNDWTRTLTLENGAVIDEDETGELVVAVTGAANIDTNDVTETWTVDFRSIRYTDAQGSSVSEDPATATRTFSFESFATATDSALKITEADNDAVNKAHVINVHDTDNTSDVVLLDFGLENEGDDDLEIREWGAIITVTGEDNVDETVLGGTSPSLHLVIEGEDYGTAAYYDSATGIDVGAAEQIHWTDVDYILAGGETVSAQITADIDDIGGGPALGDTIMAEITETQTDVAALVDVRDASDTQLADADITGVATGEASEFRDVGFDLELVGTPTAVKTAGNLEATTSDSGLFTITFDVTAWDGDIFIDGTGPTTLVSSDTESSLTVTGTGTLLATMTSPSGALDPAGGGVTFRVAEDDTERFTITADIRDNAANDLVDGFFDVALANLLYALTDVDGNLDYTFNLGDFKTPQIFLDDQGT